MIMTIYLTIAVIAAIVISGYLISEKAGDDMFEILIVSALLSMVWPTLLVALLFEVLKELRK